MIFISKGKRWRTDLDENEPDHGSRKVEVRWSCLAGATVTSLIAGPHVVDRVPLDRHAGTNKGLPVSRGNLDP